MTFKSKAMIHGRVWTRAAGVLLALLVLWAVSAPGHAHVYRCVDQAGHVTYQETTCDGMAPGAAPAAALANAWPASGKHIFWKAKSADGGQVYLFGSLHFAAPWIYPLPAAIYDALASADALVVEADVLKSPPGQLAAQLAQHGTYPGDTRLKDVLAPAEWEALSNVTRTIGLPAVLFERQRPWLASMTLTAAVLQQLGYTSDHGIDLHLMREAASRTPIIELESVEYQFKLLSEMQQKDQVAMLMQTLHEIAEAGRHFGDMLEAWLKGDAEKLDRVLFEGFDRMVRGEQIYQRLISDRNIEMMSAIGRLSREHDVIFVVVGAGHLVGANGLIERMKAGGFYVEQL